MNVYHPDKDRPDRYIVADNCVPDTEKPLFHIGNDERYPDRIGFLIVSGPT